MISATEEALRRDYIYTLPNGETLVVGVGTRSRYFLYHERVWEGSEWTIGLPVAYEVNEQGLILRPTGEPTSWVVGDLRSLGRVLPRRPKGHAHFSS